MTEQDDWVEKKITERNGLKQQIKFIEQWLKDIGVTLKDSPEGTTWMREDQT